MKEPNLNECICGMIKTSSGFGDLALISKVTAELNRSNLSVCGDICFFLQTMLDLVHLLIF